MTTGGRALALSIALCAGAAAPAALAERPYPILFVTQTPQPADFTTVGSTFGNHSGSVHSAPRGGDLWILYPDGSRRNLTREAGYGAPGDGEEGAVDGGFQGAGAIAVREPAVDWSGEKAIFSMLVGSPAARYEVGSWRWQLYEVTGLGPDDAPAVVTKVASQPEAYNNVSPAYLSDGRIVFTSDRPRDGAAHLWPQRDEYESSPIVSGLWALDPESGELVLFDHSPSGDFKPIVDSFGRIVFTRWDHLQRDQQADADRAALASGGASIYGTFDYASEAPGAPALDQRLETFPEPRNTGTPAPTPPENGLRINQFFPWMLNQDGTGLETVNHVGRHELLTYFEPSRLDDPNLDEFLCGQNACGRANEHAVTNLFQMRESVAEPGLYVGVSAPEFGTHAAGGVLSLAGGTSLLGDEMEVEPLTHPATESVAETPGPCHSGLYRSPLPLSDGSLVVVHAGERSPGVPETRSDANEGSTAAPQSRYAFRLRSTAPTAAGDCAGHVEADAFLTPGLTKTFWYWSPDQRVDFVAEPLWELDPVEVRPRTPPAATGEPPIPGPEASIFADEGVDPVAFRTDLEAKGLALVVSRDVTTRDVADRQQPFNLRVPGGSAQTLGAGGTVYDVEYLQFLQGDLIRGLGYTTSIRAGRRVVARPLHELLATNPPLDPADPPGSVEVAADGSTAALVPAHRAMTWQLTTGGGAPVVRERYWLTFQPGEVRVCTSCHGLNREDQAGGAEPANPPEALRALLQWWKGVLFVDGFDRDGTAPWSAAVP